MTSGLAFVRNATSNEYVFNGLSVESVTSGRLRFVRKFHKLFRFVDGYLPAEVKPTVAFDFESLLTFSEEERLVCDKVYLSIDPEQITPDYGFIQKVKAALTGKDGDVDKYQALVEVLNEWGWYVPLNFTLGSALYATQIKEVDSFEQARTESTNFSANFKTEFKQLAGGAGNSSFFELGGSIIGKDNFNDWLNSLDDATTWDVIGYTKLYPSLMLLNNTENATLTDCLGLLRKFYTNQYVKDLQKYISVKDYEFQIAKIVSPVYE
ncbi:hypothetical protein HA402_001963 [Bradysia odoriphaga]|nr:hypothetical protein HA402_001963 [Bradysia odoriphaga]